MHYARLVLVLAALGALVLVASNVIGNVSARAARLL